MLGKESRYRVIEIKMTVWLGHSQKKNVHNTKSNTKKKSGISGGKLIILHILNGFNALKSNHCMNGKIREEI